MSTRCLIGKLSCDVSGALVSIRYSYIHWDGYPSGVGQKLAIYWSTPERVDALLDLGSLSVLGQELGQAHDFDSHYSGQGPWRGLCLAYGRDRGDHGTEACTVTTLEQFYQAGHEAWAEYLYLYDASGQWQTLCEYQQHWLPLEQAQQAGVL